ncbi:hypothetical protein B5X24_HaOG214699 [Helicoverpa armigera]|nr:hypothetical protein B5X24_HaOG214699 [Helicoverpa armigera]
MYGTVGFMSAKNATRKSAYSNFYNTWLKENPFFSDKWCFFFHHRTNNANESWIGRFNKKKKNPSRERSKRTQARRFRLLTALMEARRANVTSTCFRATFSGHDDTPTPWRSG